MAVLDTISKPFVKVFGSRNDRVVKSYRKQAEEVTQLEPQILKLTDAQLRDRAQELRQKVSDGTPAQSVKLEALAIMRESLDRNIGIRSIFHPELREQFDPSKLSPEPRHIYDQLLAEADALDPINVLGSDEPVPGYLQIDIPNVLYDAVRQMYPESRPPFRCRPFDVQLIGGMVLFEGKIAEMKTGEGKTIVAPLACFLAAIEGLQCHVVTVNDYLVQRDRDWVFPAFHRLGFTVGAIHPMHMQPPEAKQRAYMCDVVYGTNSEFGFDYLRDNMKLRAEEQVQKKRDFCIVDEIDSILIDEARTPLIISGPAHDEAPQYIKANQVAEQLKRFQQQANQETRNRIAKEGFVNEAASANKVSPAEIEKIIGKFRDLGPDFLTEKDADMIGHVQYYVVKREQKAASMTAIGVEEAQKIVGTRFYVVGNDMAWDHLINNAVRAHTVYEKDREYVVQNGEVVIVDENTGRLMVGRQWSDGLHQAIEAKEAHHGVKIKQETQTLATITIQNFFKLYKRLAGMTGTAMTEATEFMDIYGLDAVAIPTNRPIIRQDDNDLIFLTEEAKWKAILEEVVEHHQQGRPVLVGTTSVEKSEGLANLLKKKHGVDHEILNAKQHEREAHIIAKAGQQHVNHRDETVGNVTIATNMAGRGTDIKLAPEVVEAGGLHIVGTERHEARRIDNQLRGRAGRQGDPGSSRFFISMEDDLMKMFAGKQTMKALSMLGMQEDDAIEHRWISRSVERAQRKVEERNFQIRKNLLEYDEVMEYQRNYFYGTRQKVLEGKEVRELISEYFTEAIEDAVARYYDPDYIPNQVAEAVRSTLGVSVDPAKLRGDELADVEQVIRSDAKAEVRQDIEITVGEYMTEEVPDEEWDLKGLASWAMSRFSVDLKIAKLKKMTPHEVVDHLTDVAHELIDRKSLDGIDRYFAPGYAAGELANWARQKFALELTIEELQPQKNESHEQAQQRVAELIYERADAAYSRREIEYPIRFILDMVFGAIRDGGDQAAPWAAEQLVKWANHRFDLGWTADEVRTKEPDQIFRELLEASEQWHNDKLEAWLDKTLADNPDNDTLAERVKDRWVVRLRDEDFEAEDRRAMLRDKAIRVMRAELTQLERYVLLQILDQSWKDHLYGMDQLKDTIGLRGFGEKDPKIEYKREGSKQFREMLAGVRDKVTDMIFKARLTPQVQMRNPYARQQATHEQSESTGVGGSGGAGGGTATAATPEQRADQRAADRAGSKRQVTKTIVNKSPEVGRNDPCPCGSGKKYKKCCGQAA